MIGRTRGKKGFSSPLSCCLFPLPVGFYPPFLLGTFVGSKQSATQPAQFMLSRPQTGRVSVHALVLVCLLIGWADLLLHLVVLISCCCVVCFPVPSNGFMASARSFNTFNCMLQIKFHCQLAHTYGRLLN